MADFLWNKIHNNNIENIHESSTAIVLPHILLIPYQKQKGNYFEQYF